VIEMADPQDKILKIIQTVTRAKAPLAVGLDESLFDSGVLDSFGLPELVSALEVAFSIKIPDADLSAQTFESVNRIAAYIQKRS
jgi:acyl carrier protein